MTITVELSVAEHQAVNGSGGGINIMYTQQIITIAFVAFAVLYLALRAVRKARGQESDCDGCAGGCGKPVTGALGGKRAAPQATPLVTLGPPPRRKS